MANEKALSYSIDIRIPTIGILALFFISLDIASRLFAGEYAISFFSPERILGIAVYPIGFILSLSIVLLVYSAIQARNFKRVDNQIDITSLWKSMRPAANPLTACLVMILMGYGISGTGSLNELYRLTTSTWFDSQLWQLESPLFSALLKSWINIPAFWDFIYFSFWGILFLSLAVVFYRDGMEKIIIIAFAAVIAFYVTRIINLLYPTMGPCFYNPDLFSLAGTSSADAQNYLRRYMEGSIQQNGMVPATMAMPSLHVGLTAMAVWALSTVKKWTLWFSIPWMIFLWASTVFLGWHYALDGVAGIGVATFSVLASNFLLRQNSYFP